MSEHDRASIMHAFDILRAEMQKISLMIDLLSKECNENQLWDRLQQVKAEIRDKEG